MARVWIFGDDVDTDQIVPGRFAPYMRPNEDVGRAAFIEARPDFAANAEPGDVIVAGANFGCGSSREYAVEALVRRRVGAVIAASFARIFFRNAINNGFLALECAEAVDTVVTGDTLELDVEAGILRNLTRGGEARFVPLSTFARELLQAGGLLPYVLARRAGAEATR